MGHDADEMNKWSTAGAVSLDKTAEGLSGASKMTVQRSLTVVFLTSIMPGIASAQTSISSAPLPEPPSPPLVLFTETVAKSEPSRLSLESLKSSSWWEPPTDNSEIPRWMIGQTVTFNTAAGLAVSAGLFGRRADPLPLFLSQGITRETQRFVSNSVTDPDNYRLRWDAKFGVTAPLWDRPRLKFDGIGEVFVPLGSTEPSLGASRQKSYGSLLKAFRFGIVSGF